MSIVGPIAPYSNVPIHADYYKPREFFISAITTGRTTVVTTSSDHDYVVGQKVRLLIPTINGAQQLNRREGYVISIPSTTSVTVEIDSSGYNAFISNPYEATITNITRANPCVVTASNYFVVNNRVTISDVAGMTQLNGNTYSVISSNSSSFTLNVDSSSFSSYTSGGTGTLYTTYKTLPQIVAIGDINSGVTSNSTFNNVTTYIPGSFINIS